MSNRWPSSRIERPIADGAPPYSRCQKRVAEHHAGRRASLHVVGRRRATRPTAARTPSVAKYVAADVQTRAPAALRRQARDSSGLLPHAIIDENTRCSSRIRSQSGIRQHRPACHELSGAAVRRLDDADFDQLLGTLDRQRAQADRVDELEDRGVGAGAERQRQDRDDGERRVAAQQARAVAEVLPERLEEARASSWCRSPRG